MFLTRHQISRGAAVLLSTCAACQGSVVATPDASGQDRVEAGPMPATTLATVVDRASARAGESVSVSCYLRDGADFYLPEVEVTATIEPTPDQISTTPGGVSFIATEAGSYRVACRAVGGDAVDSTGAAVAVEPGDAYSWVVDMPAQDCFAQIDRLPLEYEVYDLYGNRIETPQVSAVVVPDDGVERDPFGALSFAYEGDYDLTLTYAGRVDSRGSIEPVAMNIRVDSSAPRFVGVTPERGSMLQVGSLADTEVVVAGSVEDSLSPIARIEVDGVTIPVSGHDTSEAFQVTLSSRWGLSVASGTATDECGNVAALAHAFLRSPAWYAPALWADPTARVDQGFTAQLNQSFVDDHDRADIDDIATLVDTALSSYDFNALVGPGTVLLDSPARDDCSVCGLGPTWMSDGYSVMRHPDAGRRITIEGPWVGNVDLVDGGISLAVNAGSFAFPLRVKAESRSCTLGCEDYADVTVSGEVGFSSIAASGTLGVTTLDGETVASLTDVQLEIQGAYLDLDCGLLDGVCDSITEMIIEMALEELEAGLIGALSTMVPPVLEAAMQELELSSALELPAPLDTTLNVAAGLDRLLFCGTAADIGTPAACPAGDAGFAQTSLSVQFFPSVRGRDIPPDARGAIKRGGSIPVFSTTEYGFGLAAKDDLVNQLFWAIWYGGGLSIDDVGAALGPEAPAGLTMSMTAMLPPVVMPGRHGTEFDVGIGDLVVEFSADINGLLGNDGEPVVLAGSAYVSFVLGMDLDIDPTSNQIIGSFQLDPHMEVAHIDQPIAKYHGVLSQMIVDATQKLLPDLMAKSLSSMELPHLDLSDVAGMPQGTFWRLQNADLNHTDDSLVFTGTIGI